MLAIWGNDKTGKPYVHIRIYKQGKIFGDVLVHGGEVKICCRECVRWHCITFVGEQRNKAQLIQTNQPGEIDDAPRGSDTRADEGQENE